MEALIAENGEVEIPAWANHSYLVIHTV